MKQSIIVHAGAGKHRASLKDVDNISEDGSFIRQSLPDRLNPNKWHQKPNEHPFMLKVQAIKRANAQAQAQAQALTHGPFTGFAPPQVSNFTPTTFATTHRYNQPPRNYLSRVPGSIGRAPTLSVKVTAEDWVKLHPDPYKDDGNLRSIRKQIRKYEPWALEYEQRGGKKKRNTKKKKNTKKKRITKKKNLSNKKVNRVCKKECNKTRKILPLLLKKMGLNKKEIAQKMKEHNDKCEGNCIKLMNDKTLIEKLMKKK